MSTMTPSRPADGYDTAVLRGPESRWGSATAGWHVRRRCAYSAYMTAEPIPPPPDPGRNPAAIRDMLPAADRADFAAAYAAALEEARRTWSLRPVDDALEQWRRIAVLSRIPGHAESLEHARRLLAGEDVPVYAVDLEALRRGDIPAAWPTN